MAAPPTDVGAVQETSEAPSAFEVAATPVGDPGGVAGVAEFEGTEAALMPLAFFATTVNVYGVPFVRPVTVMGEELPDAITAVPPPTGVAVTV